MPKRKFGNRKRKARKGKRRLFKRKGRKAGRRKGRDLKTQVRGGQRPISLLGNQPTLPNRVVLKTGLFTDWNTTPFAGTGAQQVYMINMLATHNPVASLPLGSAVTYQGLNLYLSPIDQVGVHYAQYRILHSKITVEINRATSPTNSLKFVLLPDPVIGGSAISGSLNVLALESQPYAKSMMVQNDTVGTKSLSMSVSPRKLIGYSKVKFDDQGFYAVANVNPANSLNWVFSIQPANGNAEPTGTWCFRVKMQAMIELTRPWSMPLST